MYTKTTSIHEFQRDQRHTNYRSIKLNRSYFFITFNCQNSKCIAKAWSILSSFRWNLLQLPPLGLFLIRSIKSSFIIIIHNQSLFGLETSIFMGPKNGIAWWTLFFYFLPVFNFSLWSFVCFAENEVEEQQHRTSRWNPNKSSTLFLHMF